MISPLPIMCLPRIQVLPLTRPLGPAYLPLSLMPVPRIGKKVKPVAKPINYGNGPLSRTPKARVLIVAMLSRLGAVPLLTTVRVPPTFVSVVNYVNGDNAPGLIRCR